MTPLEELKQLPVDERIKLVEDLWDTIATDATAFSLSQAQKDELDLRLSDLDRNPNSGIPWEELRDRLQRRL